MRLARSGAVLLLFASLLPRPAGAWQRAATPDTALLARARLALARRDSGALRALVPVLRGAVADTAAAPELLLARGRVEHALGHADSALAAFARYEATRVHPGLGVLERARLQLQSGDREAEAAYFASAEQGDSATIAELRADLLALLSDDDLKAFDAAGAAGGASRAAWLRTFWHARDAEDLRREGERLAEHYRRLEYARAHFPLEPGTVRHYLPGAALRSPVSDMDDRGVVYVRHGPPTKLVASWRDGPQLQELGPAQPLPAMETWLYRRPDGDVLLNFRGCATYGMGRGFAYGPGICPGPIDYQLVETPLDVFGANLARRVVAGAAQLRDKDSLLMSGVEQMLLMRRNLSTRFADLLGADQYTLPLVTSREIRLSAADIAVGVGSDSYLRAYGRDLPGRIEVHLAGRQGDRVLMHVSYALDARAFAPVETDGRWLYPMRLRVVVRDTAGRVVATLDQPRVFRAAHRLGPRESILGRADVAVPAGQLSYRISLEHDDDVGTVLPTEQAHAPEIREGRLAMSDVILGHSSIPLVWTPTPGDTVRFNPTAAFDSSATLAVYHEIYGLPAGAPYHVSLKVTREKRGLAGKLFGGASTGIELSADEASTGLVTTVHRELDLRRLGPGAYGVTVVVTTDDGQSATRHRYFEVRRIPTS